MTETIGGLKRRTRLILTAMLLLASTLAGTAATADATAGEPEVTEGSYLVRSVRFDRYLDGSPGNNVRIGSETDERSQWNITSNGDGTYTFKNKDTGAFLDADGRNRRFDVNQSRQASDDIRWQIKSADDGNVYIINESFDRLLDANGPRSRFNVNTARQPREDRVWELIPVDGNSDFVGAVYVQTNAIEGNEVAGYGRNIDGSLTPLGNFATGGTGSTEFDGGEGLDPLISADSVIVTDDQRFLLTVNAGSDTVTAFAINDDFTLTKTSEVSSGGVGPNSLAYSNGRVFVTNIDRDGLAFGDPDSPRAEPNDEGNVVGFRLGTSGRLRPLRNSVAELDNRPANIGFSEDGERLIVSAITSGSAALPGDNAEASLYVFDVNRRGGLTLADTGTSTSRDNGEGRNLPSAIDFDSVILDGNEYVVVTEAREFNSDGAPPAFPALQAGSVSVYALGGDSSLTLTEGDFAFGDASQENQFGANGQQLTACWIDFGHDGSTFYVSNAVNATISSLRLENNGSVTVLDTVAAAGTSAFAQPGVPVDGPTAFGRTDGFIDLDVSDDGKYLYQLEGLSGNVGVYAIDSHGSLELVQEVTGTLPDIDTQGIISVSR